MSHLLKTTPSFLGGFNITIWIRKGSAALLCAFLLSACSPEFSFLKNDAEPQPASAATMRAQPPPGAAMHPSPAPQPTGKASTTDLAATAATLASIQPAHGIIADNLFSEPVNDPNARFARLETVVGAMQHELNEITPAIQRLNAVEEDISILVQQLQLLLQNEPPLDTAVSQGQKDNVALTPTAPGSEAGSPVALVADDLAEPAGMPAPSSSPDVTASTEMPRKETPVSTGSATVKRLRIGEHDDRTRLVLDATKATAYRYDLDNAERLLIIELPDAGWGGQGEWSSPQSPLITSYSAQPMANGQGTRLIVQLKKDTAVIKESAYHADGTPDYRIVLDLSK